MESLLKVVGFVLSVIVAIYIIGWIGFSIQPAPFEPYPQEQPELEMIPVPSGLPAPVQRFYNVVFGDEMPVIESAVITGKGRLRPFGPVYMPSRFRFVHIAGQGYRHYIESTFFGIPIFKVNERYVDGVSEFLLPFFPPAVNDPKINQGANLGMWSESLWMPSIFLTDPRVRWEPVDDVTAILVVPFENAEERYVVRFNPQTGLADFFEVMRYQGADSVDKVLWLNQGVKWAEIDGQLTMQEGAAIWMDDGKPWAYFTVEDIVFNVDVREYIRAKGP